MREMWNEEVRAVSIRAIVSRLSDNFRAEVQPTRAEAREPVSEIAAF